jgi:hypothetical protein
MLVESGISVAPLERPRAPDAKHMAPPSVNTRSRVRRVEPLAAVVEKSASSDSDNSNSEDDNNNESSGESEGGDDASGDNDDNATGDDEDASGDDEDAATGDEEDNNKEDDEANEDEDEDADVIKDDNPDANEDDNGNDPIENTDDEEHDNAISESTGDQHGDNNNKSETESETEESDSAGKHDDNGAKAASVIPGPEPEHSQVSGTPARGGEPRTTVLAVPAAASVATAPAPELNRVSGTPARGGEPPTAVLPVPAAASMATAPAPERNRISGTPVRGGEPPTAVLPVPTPASAAPTPMRERNRVEPSIGKDSGTSTTDLQPIGKGSLFYFYILSLFIFNLALSPEPLPDNGIKFYFNLTSCFKLLLDIQMGNPIPLQGASRTMGGIFRGKALGNKPNHADFEDENDSGPFMVIKPKQAFKIFIYVQYGDVLEVSRVPDFASQIPITVFLLNDISPRSQPLLTKATKFHDSLSCKPCLFIAIIHLLNSI